VHDGPRGHRGLVAAVAALPEAAPGLLAGRPAPAMRTRESLRPPRREEVAATGVLVGEAGLELEDAAREVGAVTRRSCE
jgi:hypothetical protein